jgi:predicted secreted Zn-dependent protease
MSLDDDEQWAWARAIVRTWPRWSEAQWRAVNATLGYDVGGAPSPRSMGAPTRSKGSAAQAKAAR